MELEDRYDGVQKLIDMGREKGYLSYEEVSEHIPLEVAASAEA